MVQVGSLYASLTLQHAQFDSGLRRASANARRTEAEVGSSFSRMAAAGAAAVAAVAAIGGTMIAQGARQLLDYAGGLGEVSQQIGLTVEQYQVLSRAALASGVAQQTLEGGLARLNRVLGEARAGSANAIRAFENLGISREQLRNLHQAGDVLPLVMDGVRRLGDSSTQTAAAQRILGRAAGQLLPILTQGADGYEQMRREAEAAGLITAEMAAKADEAADQLALLAWTARQNLAIALVGLLDPIRDVANGFGTIATEARGAISSMLQALGLRSQMQSGGAGTGGSAAPETRWQRFTRRSARWGPLVIIGSAVNGLRELGSESPAQMRAQARTRRRRGDSFWSGRNNPPLTLDLSNNRGGSSRGRSAGGQGGGGQDPLRRARDMVEQLRFQEDQLARTGREQEIYNNLHQAGVMATSALGQEITRLTGALYDDRARNDYNEWLEEITTRSSRDSALLGLEGRAEAQENFYWDMIERRRRLGATTETNGLEIVINGRGMRLDDEERAAFAAMSRYWDLREAVDAATASRERFTESIRQSIEAAEREQQRIRDLGEQFGESFANIGIQGFQNLIRGAKSFGDVFRDMITELGDLFLDVLIYEPLRQMARNWGTNLFAGNSGAGGFFGSLFRGLIGGGPSSGSVGTYGADLGESLSTGIYGRALGGPITAGGSYWVGERGPELFRPSQAGTIIPNNALRSGRTVVNVTVNGGNNPAETRRLVAEAIWEAMPAITEASTAKTMRRAGRPRIN